VVVQAAELIASRRRLLLAADLERQQLEARLREGPERRLVDVAETLSRVSPDANGPSIESLDRAKSQLSHALVELDELGRGLHPRDLVEAGLQGALASLAERTPIPVDLEVSVMRLPDEFEAAVYFVSAEALANVVKYASASRATLTVAATDHRLSVVVADDGIGDADPSHGTGLQGLADRIEALGGTLQVDSPPGGGTRLTTEIPLDGAVR
jgi:signal transduction histidine kinase